MVVAASSSCWTVVRRSRRTVTYRRLHLRHHGQLGTRSRAVADHDRRLGVPLRHHRHMREAHRIWGNALNVYDERIGHGDPRRHVEEDPVRGEGGMSGGEPVRARVDRLHVGASQFCLVSPCMPTASGANTPLSPRRLDGDCGAIHHLGSPGCEERPLSTSSVAIGSPGRSANGSEAGSPGISDIAPLLFGPCWHLQLLEPLETGTPQLPDPFGVVGDQAVEHGSVERRHRTIRMVLALPP